MALGVGSFLQITLKPREGRIGARTPEPLISDRPVPPGYLSNRRSNKLYSKGLLYKLATDATTEAPTVLGVVP